jgi:hypothetical protein
MKPKLAWIEALIEELSKVKSPRIMLEISSCGIKLGSRIGEVGLVWKIPGIMLIKGSANLLCVIYLRR